MRIEVPLPNDLTQELTDFWEEIFGNSYESSLGIFEGKETEQNHDIFYFLREGEALGGTCHLTISRTNPELGGLGEVATNPKFRRKGIAYDLCGMAREEFGSKGGKALFLGTGNPEALRVYARLGWRKLAGANVMGLIVSEVSPETFLVDYFREGGTARIGPGTVADRIPMIPLIVAPHDWQILDGNTGLISTRYATQGSCMGLYPRFEGIGLGGRGAWFVARSDRGKLVGLATARLDDSGSCRVDGFTHQVFMNAWDNLMGAAMDWGFGRDASSCWASVSIEDEDKRSRFESLGFQEVGSSDGFDLDSRPVGALKMEIRDD